MCIRDRNRCKAHDRFSQSSWQTPSHVFRMGWLRRICRSRHHPAAFVKMPRNLCPSGLGEGIIFQFRLQILCSFVISSPFFCTLAVSFHVSGVRAGIEPATIDLLLYRPHPWSAWFLCSTMAELPHSYFSFNFCISYEMCIRDSFQFWRMRTARSQSLFPSIWPVCCQYCSGDSGMS